MFLYSSWKGTIVFLYIYIYLVALLWPFFSFSFYTRFMLVGIALHTVAFIHYTYYSWTSSPTIDICSGEYAVLFYICFRLITDRLDWEMTADWIEKLEDCECIHPLAFLLAENPSCFFLFLYVRGAMYESLVLVSSKNLLTTVNDSIHLSFILGRKGQVIMHR